MLHQFSEPLHALLQGLFGHPYHGGPKTQDAAPPLSEGVVLVAAFNSTRSHHGDWHYKRGFELTLGNGLRR